MSDTELLDALQWFIDNNGGLLIHNDGYLPNRYPGLGVRCTSRTLRQALEQSMAESAARTTRGVEGGGR